MSVCIDVCMSKMMRMPIKVGVWKYATYANCQTLLDETLSFYKDFHRFTTSIFLATHQKCSFIKLIFKK